jgi:hypothetical protein
MSGFGGGGGGGAPGAGSALYKGAFPTLAGLNTAFPSGSVGWFAYVGADKYEWNPATLAWESPLLQLTADPGETIAPGVYVNGAGKQWLNDTAANLTVPAVVTSANMIAAGFTDVTGTTTVPLYNLIDPTDVLMDGTDFLIER